MKFSQGQPCVMPEIYLPAETVENMAKGQQRYLRTSEIIVIRHTRQVFVPQMAEVTTQMPALAELHLYCLINRRSDKGGSFHIRILVPGQTRIQYSTLTFAEVFDTYYVPISSVTNITE